ncbi:MAG: beta-ketoacyl-ACP synthase III [Acidimicrobiia bacterium]
MRRATITGWGKCLPPAVLSNADLESVMDTSDEWITARSGIKERRVSHVETSDMATVAGHQAIAAAGLTREDIDLLVVCTCSPDRLIPSAASFVQAKLGVSNAAAIDLNAACTGFLYGVSMASGMITAGMIDRALVIGVEKLSAYLNLEVRSTGVLFGDGAGAVVLEPATGDEGLLAVNLGSDGNLAELLTVTHSGTEYVEEYLHDEPTIYMEGREIFRNAVVQMANSATEALAEVGFGVDDVDLLVPHQANVRIIDATAKRLKLPPEKVYVNIASYGNTSAATIPIALTEALEEGRVEPGATVVFVAFGGGLTWGAAVMRWGDRIDPLGVSDAALPPTEKTALEILASRPRRLQP